MLLDLLDDGTAETAWNCKVDALTGAWFEHLDRHEASRLIAQGFAARRMLEHEPFLDEARPPRPQNEPSLAYQTDAFDAEAFDRELAAIRARQRCGRVIS
jgi:hypothetical protein